MHVLVAMADTDTRADFFPPRIRDRLEAMGTVEWNDSASELTEAELAERIPGVDVLITGWGSPQVTAEVLDAADDLQLLAHTGGSVATHASAALYDAGIPVVAANDVMADHTAELAFTVLLAKLRCVPELDASMHRGEWDRGDWNIRTLHDKEVGLVGLGAIGGKVLDHLAPFSPDVSVYDPYLDESALADVPFAELADLDAVLDSEIVSIHAARTPETRGMLGADELARIPDDGVLINTARAQLIVEEALMAELRSGRISAALDVYYEEPLPEDHELRDVDNVLLTPHVGGSQIRPPLTEAVLDEIDRLVAGEDFEYEIPRAQWETMTR